MDKSKQLMLKDITLLLLNHLITNTHSDSTPTMTLEPKKLSASQIETTNGIMMLPLTLALALKTT